MQGRAGRYSARVEKHRRGRIYLIGFMGSGKSSVGSCLARELGFRFIDLDQEIEKGRGLAVSEIFERDGEPEFRRLEAAALRGVGDLHDVVVATGGGTLTRWENRDFIRRTGVSVWLDAPLDVMLERCRDGARRPLLSTPDRMEALLAERLAGYRTADLRAETAGRTPLEVARLIASQVAALL
jgi:shikimate kinase